MSWWDRFLAPGDVRARQQLLEQHTPPPHLQREIQKHGADLPRRRTPLTQTQRARRQNGLLFGGLAFSFLSLFITRRALKRKQLPPQAKRLSPSSGADASAAENPPPPVDGGLEAVQALGFATLNVFSIGMAGLGAAMTYFDIADAEELREVVRKAVGYDVYDGESEVDREMETWVAEVLAKKDGTGGMRDGIKEKLLEMEKRELERKEKEGRRR